MLCVESLYKLFSVKATNVIYGTGRSMHTVNTLTLLKDSRATCRQNCWTTVTKIPGHLQRYNMGVVHGRGLIRANVGGLRNWRPVAFIDFCGCAAFFLSFPSSRPSFLSLSLSFPSFIHIPALAIVPDLGSASAPPAGPRRARRRNNIWCILR